MESEIRFFEEKKIQQNTHILVTFKLLGDVETEDRASRS
jgi:hypothetical protein